MAAAEFMLQLYLLEFYTSVVGLTPGLAGIALGLAVLWDAVTDPLMGAVSDQTRTRFGMRRPYVLGGAFVLAVAFYFVFHPPSLATDGGKFVYLLVSYLAVNTGMTILSVPHLALAGELTFDPDARTKLFGWRMLFRLIGSLVGTVLPGVLVAGATEQLAVQSARAESSSWIAALVIASVLITLWALRGRDPDNRSSVSNSPRRAPAEQVRAFFRSLAHAVRNPVFVPLILGFVVAEAGRVINTSLGLYYYKIWLQLSDEEFTLIVGVLMLSVAASLPLWVRLSGTFGKKRPAFAGAFGLGLFTAFVYPVMPTNNVWIPLVLAGIGGGIMAGSIILLESLVADVVDYDELKSGQHREGLYYGCWMLARKLCRALGLALTGGMLEWTGYQEGSAEQAAEVGYRVMLLFGPAVGVFFMTGAVIFLWMPLTAERHRRVQALLERRRRIRARRRDTART